MVQALPFGSWPSPLSAAGASAASPRFEGAAFVGDDVWWGESIPAEGGRTAVRRRTATGEVEDVLPAPWNARSRVHEYGGGSWAASEDGRLFFVEKTDQRVWAVHPGGEPLPLTPEGDDVRFGGLRWQEGVLLAVRESHGASRIPDRAIVSIAVDGDVDGESGVVPLVAGSHFVAQPALSPGGTHLAWIAWNHPDMPWDRTELRVGRIRNGVVSEWTTVTTGDTAALQPEWIGDDELLYIDDPTGRWNLWQVRLDEDRDEAASAPAAWLPRMPTPVDRCGFSGRDGLRVSMTAESSPSAPTAATRCR